jgi:hypothetical protein
MTEQKKGKIPSHRLYLCDENGDMIKEYNENAGKEVSVEVGAGWASYKADGSISVMMLKVNEVLQPGIYKIFPSLPPREGAAQGAASPGAPKAGGYQGASKAPYQGAQGGGAPRAPYQGGKSGGPTRPARTPAPSR